MTPALTVERSAPGRCLDERQQQLIDVVRRRDPVHTQRLADSWVHRRGLGSLEAFRLDTLGPLLGTEAADWMDGCLRDPHGRVWSAAPQPRHDGVSDRAWNAPDASDLAPVLAQRPDEIPAVPSGTDLSPLAVESVSSGQDMGLAELVPAPSELPGARAKGPGAPTEDSAAPATRLDAPLETFAAHGAMPMPAMAVPSLWPPSAAGLDHHLRATEPEPQLDLPDPAAPSPAVSESLQEPLGDSHSGWGAGAPHGSLAAANADAITAAATVADRASIEPPGEWLQAAVDPAADRDHSGGTPSSDDALGPVISGPSEEAISAAAGLLSDVATVPPMPAAAQPVPAAPMPADAPPRGLRRRLMGFAPLSKVGSLLRECYEEAISTLQAHAEFSPLDEPELSLEPPAPERLAAPAPTRPLAASLERSNELTIQPPATSAESDEGRPPTAPAAAWSGPDGGRLPFAGLEGGALSGPPAPSPAALADLRSWLPESGSHSRRAS